MKSLHILLVFHLLAILHAHEISYGLGMLNVPDTTYEPIPLFHIPVDSVKNPGLMSKYLMTFLNIPDQFYITPF
jgi:hypothetical protein